MTLKTKSSSGIDDIKQSQRKTLRRKNGDKRQIIVLKLKNF